MTNTSVQDPSVHHATDLIHHIETHFHARHREQFLMLAAMAERVEDVHFSSNGVPDGLSASLCQMIGGMEVHMKKDELILFPAIRRGEVLGIEQPITVMRADHAAHGRRVAEIQRMTANLSLPNGACGTWTRLCDGLAEFTDDLTEPMRLENEVLFSQFEPAGHADA